MNTTTSPSEVPLKEKILSSTKVNGLAIVLLLLVGLVTVLPYLYFIGNINAKTFLSGHWDLALMIALTVVHECIHYLVAWVYLGTNKPLRFGFNSRYLAPYVHCSALLTRNQYIVMLLMPTLWVGVLPLILAFVFQSFPLLIVADVLIAGGIGDMLMTYELLPFPKDMLFLDHPTAPGFLYTEDKNLVIDEEMIKAVEARKEPEQTRAKAKRLVDYLPKSTSMRLLVIVGILFFFVACFYMGYWIGTTLK